MVLSDPVLAVLLTELGYLKAYMWVLTALIMGC